MTEDTVRKIREIVEEHAGEIPVTITIVDLPAEVAASTGAPQMRLKVNHHFRVQPGPRRARKSRRYLRRQTCSRRARKLPAFSACYTPFRSEVITINRRSV